jgi:hypothetical protein
MSGIRPNLTGQAGLLRSVDRGRPEVSAIWSTRRDQQVARMSAICRINANENPRIRYAHPGPRSLAERWRKREAAGDMIIVRYADDIIVGFEHEADARCFLEVPADGTE